MKKIISILVTLVFTLTLCGCGGDASKAEATDNQTIEASTDTEQNKNANNEEKTKEEKYFRSIAEAGYNNFTADKAKAIAVEKYGWDGNTTYDVINSEIINGIKHYNVIVKSTEPKYKKNQGVIEHIKICDDGHIVRENGQIID